MRKLVFFFSFLLSMPVFAQTCLNDYGKADGCAKNQEAYSCEELGFSKNVTGCSKVLSCPFDASYKRCVYGSCGGSETVTNPTATTPICAKGSTSCADAAKRAADCMGLGYTNTNVANCTHYITCPFDESYKACAECDCSGFTLTSQLANATCTSCTSSKGTRYKCSCNDGYKMNAAGTACEKALTCTGTCEKLNKAGTKCIIDCECNAYRLSASYDSGNQCHAIGCLPESLSKWIKKENISTLNCEDPRQCGYECTDEDTGTTWYPPVCCGGCKDGYVSTYENGLTVCDACSWYASTNYPNVNATYDSNSIPAGCTYICDQPDDGGRPGVRMYLYSCSDKIVPTPTQKSCEDAIKADFDNNERATNGAVCEYGKPMFRYKIVNGSIDYDQFQPCTTFYLTGDATATAASFKVEEYHFKSAASLPECYKDSNVKKNPTLTITNASSTGSGGSESTIIFDVNVAGDGRFGGIGSWTFKRNVSLTNLGVTTNPAMGLTLSFLANTTAADKDSPYKASFTFTSGCMNPVGSIQIKKGSFVKDGYSIIKGVCSEPEYGYTNDLFNW